MRFCHFFCRIAAKSSLDSCNWWRKPEYPAKTTDMMRWCENLAKIVCRSSRLKADDYRLKGSPQSAIACTLCDSYSIENIKHIVMQCPYFESTRVNLRRELDSLDPVFEGNLRQNPSMSFYWMLGGQMEGLSFEEMFNFWIVTWKSINSMYTTTVKSRVGIG